jgi:hypothetical protein
MLLPKLRQATSYLTQTIFIISVIAILYSVLDFLHLLLRSGLIYRGLFYYFGPFWMAKEPFRGDIEIVLFDAFFGVVIMSYSALFLIPLILSFPLIIPLILFWKKPTKFLLLRSFNRGWPNVVLKRIARKNLSNFGHIYTLADKDIKVPLWTRATMLLGQLSLLSFRHRSLSKKSHIRGLRRILKKTWLRNLNWCLSYSKIFPISCSNSLWQPSVYKLVDIVDIVVIDISEMRTNILWELDCVISLGMERRVIFLIATDHYDDVLPKLISLLGYTPDLSRFILYDLKGPSEEHSINNKISRCLEDRRKINVSINEKIIGLENDINSPEKLESLKISSRNRILSATLLSLLIIAHQIWVYYLFTINLDFWRAFLIYSPFIISAAIVFGLCLSFTLRVFDKLKSKIFLFFVFWAIAIAIQFISFPDRDSPIVRLKEYACIIWGYPQNIIYEHIASDRIAYKIAARVKYQHIYRKNMIVFRSIVSSDREQECYIFHYENTLISHNESKAIVNNNAEKIMIITNPYSDTTRREYSFSRSKFNTWLSSDYIDLYEEYSPRSMVLEKLTAPRYGIVLSRSDAAFEWILNKLETKK